MSINSVNSNVTAQIQNSYSGAPENKVAAGGTQEYTNNTNNANDVGSNLDENVINAIERANHIQQGTTECQFSIHQQTKQIMIKLVDVNTHEVVKEIPSEKILDMVAKMCDLAGLFVDAKR